MSGHVHVIAGDLTRLVCDAWLVPTDDVFRISASFAAAIGVPPGSCLPQQSWNGERIRYFQPDDRGSSPATCS